MGYGIRFNNLHSYDDLGLIVLDKKITTPTKTKIKENIPFMNGTYDFSDLYGGNCFSERTLEFTFKLKHNNRIGLEFIKTKIENWLMGTNTQVKLTEDDLPGYYYLAECESTDFEDFIRFGKLKATFTAYPFKICDYEEGDIAWDDFNFELDVLQDTLFNISGSKIVSIYNSSATNITPSVICSSSMEVVKDGVTYRFNGGSSKDYRFELSIGENNMTIRGNGSIEFKFRKEVL